MKLYESVFDFRLLPRAPIMCRCDGVSFSKLTKRLNLEKPFDVQFSSWMSKSATTVASKIQGCVFGYIQSDEISFVIRTNQSNETVPWFDNRIQKIDSVISGMLSSVFTKNIANDLLITCFDCRVMSFPNLTEIINGIRWRQQDCVKNSISSAAYYEVGKKVGRGTARKMLHKLNSKERQELLFQETNINWASYQEEFKNGVVAYRKDVEVETEHGLVTRKRWVYSSAPIFQSNDGRDWLEIVLNPAREENGKKEKEEEVRQTESP